MSALRDESKKGTRRASWYLGLSVEVGSAMMTFDESKIQQADIENAIIKVGYKIKD